MAALMADHGVCSVQAEIRALADPVRSANLQRYFKTGPGEYGEGDLFLGLKVPQVRRVAKAHRDLPMDEVMRLLKSEYHEERLAALLILIHQFDKGDEALRRRIYELYLRSTRFINNWDLVDVSARRIVGAYLADKDRSILFELGRSSLLWERRIAVLATMYYTDRDEFEPTFKLAEMLLGDGEDLMHKAIGWLLREIGKRDRSAEEAFLDKHCERMPRTMLRYAIEKFPAEKRLAYMNRGRITRPVPAGKP